MVGSAKLSGRASGPVSVRYEEKRILEAVNTVRMVRTKRSLSSLLFGMESSIEASIFNVGAKNSATIWLFWSLWVVGAVGGFLAVFRILPVNCIWLSLCMLPFPFISLLVLTKDLIMELIHELEVLVIYILQIAFVVWASLQLRDKRIIFWFCYLPTMCVAPLIDAFPAHFRKRVAIKYFAGMIVIFLLWNAMLVIRWRHWTPLTVHAGDNLTLLLFYVRHLWTAVYHEDEFIMIKCRVRTIRETVKITEDPSGNGPRYSLPTPTAQQRSMVFGARHSSENDMSSLMLGLGDASTSSYGTVSGERSFGTVKEEGEDP